MAKNRQELKTTIVLDGKIDSGAYKIGEYLQRVGSQVDGVSQKLLGTVDLYADFDDAMRAAQGKLGDVTAQQMAELEEAVRGWAETTRFGATEVANATKEAASSGWELYEIYAGMPSVMTLAAAAEMDLTEGMEYLNSALAGLDLEITDSGRLIDQWVKTANSSRASVQELGESMENLGSLMTMTKDSGELLTMLAMMAEYGTKGAEAGTLLRNVLLRLVAPTQKAAEMMELLEVSEEEMADMAAMDLQAAGEAVEKLGLSAFDAEGNLKSIIEIIDELRGAVAGMTEEEMYQSLYAIFPTRTIRGIMDLLRATNEEYDAMLLKIAGSGGYAQQVAELQEGGVGGALREVQSRLEELSLTAAKAMNPQIMKGLEWISNVIGRVNDLPDGFWDVAGNAMATLAVAGPATLAVGAGLKLIGSLLTPGGLIALGAVTVGTLVTGLIELNEEMRQRRIEEAFGTVALDVANMRIETDAVTESYLANNEALGGLMDTMQTGAQNYLGLSEQMAGSLTQWAITGQTLTEEQKTGLYTLGEQMISSVMTGIENSELYDLNMLDMLFGDMTTDSETGAFINGVGWVSEYYAGIRTEAEAVGRELRDALTEALQNDELTPEDEAAIRAQLDRLAEIQMRIQQGFIDEEYGRRLYAAMRVDADSLGEYLAGNEASREAALAANRALFDAEAGNYYSAWKYNYDNGNATQAELGQFMAELAREEEAAAQKIIEDYAGFDMNALDVVFGQIGQGEAWELIKALTGSGIGPDALLTSEGWQSLLGGKSAEEAAQLLRTIAQTDQGMGNLMAGYLETAGFGDYAKTLMWATKYASQMEDAAYTMEMMGGWAEYLENMPEKVEKEPPEVPTEYVARRNGVYIYKTGTEMTATPETFWSWLGDKFAIERQAKEHAEMYTTEVQEYLDAHPGKYRIDVIQGGAITGNAAGGAPRKAMVTSLGDKLGGLFAEGGRATEPSIFGEAGAEWAIPEEHTQRTAQLLREAAAASGFSAGAVFGGKGAVTIVYAPTVTAQDARGVDAVLRADKARLDKWWKEKQLLHETEVYG